MLENMAKELFVIKKVVSKKNLTQKFSVRRYKKSLFKFFLSRIIFGPFFLNFWSEKILGPKTFWVQNELGPAKIGSEKFGQNWVSNR